MKTLLVYNPVSGAGRAADAAMRVAMTLRKGGVDACAVPTQLAPLREWLDPQLVGVDVMVVAGGDGAVRLAAPAAMRAGVAVHHLPLGTENLFAREFGMVGNAQALLRTIEASRVANVDTACANGRTFLLMASVGFDAEVVHDLAKRRGASISHWTYLRPIVSQLRRWRPPELEIRVDGEPVVNGRPGFVVVANCRQYGWRLNPAPEASMVDGLLDLVFYPAATVASILPWAIRSRLGRHIRHPALVRCRGARIEILSAHPVRFQLDGDPPGQVHELGDLGVNEDEPGVTRTVQIEVRPATLRVLTP